MLHIQLLYMQLFRAWALVCRERWGCLPGRGYVGADAGLGVQPPVNEVRACCFRPLRIR